MSFWLKINNFLSSSISTKLSYVSFCYYRFFTLFLYGLRFLSLGSWSVIKNPIIITPELIVLGKCVSLGHHGRIEGICAFNDQRFEPKITFEDGVTFQQRCNITAAGHIVIGKNTMASFDVMITDLDHEYRTIVAPVGRQGLIVKETIIGEDCFLGAGSKILAGTILGKHCIVGANSVVRGVFPDFSVIVGAPARIIKRYNFDTELWEKTDANGSFLDESN